MAGFSDDKKTAHTPAPFLLFFMENAAHSDAPEDLSPMQSTQTLSRSRMSAKKRLAAASRFFNSEYYLRGFLMFACTKVLL